MSKETISFELYVAIYTTLCIDHILKAPSGNPIFRINLLFLIIQMSVVVIVVKNDNHIVPFWVTQCASMSPGKFIPDGIIPYKLCEISSIAVSLFGT